MAKPKSAVVDQLRAIVEDAFERRATLTTSEIDGSTRPAVEQAIERVLDDRAQLSDTRCFLSSHSSFSFDAGDEVAAQ